MTAKHNALEKEFKTCLLKVHADNKAAGHPGNYFLRMIESDMGPVAAAKQLLATFSWWTTKGKSKPPIPNIKSTMEYHAARRRFKTLFTQQEIEEAKKRLIHLECIAP